MPRFAVLTHDHPRLHWDLLLEDGPACRTWRLGAEPSPAAATPAEQIADHRLVYLAYEGPVSGNRGNVTRWDVGEFEWIADSADRIELNLAGTKLRGRYLLRQSGDGWEFSRSGA